MTDAILTTISISLEAIERKANWIKADADDLARYVNLLVALPDYDTKAEEAVMSAVAAIREAQERTTEAWHNIIKLRSKANERERRLSEQLPESL